MRKQDYLLSLINSLGVNEKRYFKLFSQIQPGEKRYLQLFDYLDGKDKYDAKAIATELGMSATQLTDTKYYLQKILLQSLHNFDEESNAVNSVFNTYLEIKALLDRRHYDYALEVCDKAIVKAYVLELQPFLPALLAQKHNCLWALNRYDEMKALEEETKAALEELQELNDAMQFAGDLRRLEQLRAPANEVEALYNHPFIHKDVNELKSVRAAILWFSMQLRYYTIKADAIGELKLAQKSVQYYEAHPEVIDISPLAWLYNYNNLATAYAVTENYEAALEVVDTLLKILQKPPKNAPKPELESLEVFALYLKVHMLRNLHRHAEALALAEKVYTKRQLRTVYDQFSITLELALLYLLNAKYDAGVEKLNELLQMNTDIRKDYQQLLRPLLVIAQLYNKQYELVPYTIKSAQTWLRKEKVNNPEYSLFFKLTGNIAKPPHMNKSKDWEKLRQAVAANEMKTFDRIVDLKSLLKKA